MKHEYILCAALRADADTPPFVLIHQCRACGITRMTTRLPPGENFWHHGVLLSNEVDDAPCEPGKPMPVSPLAAVDQESVLS